MKIQFLFCLAGVHGCWNTIDNAIDDAANVVELLTLTKYFTRDAGAYGEQLISNAQDVYIDALDLFTTTDSDQPVKWWQGISTADLLTVKDDIIRMLYEGFRYVDRLVDYLDDITRTACSINVIATSTEQYLDPIIAPITNQTIPIYGNITIEIPPLSLSPCKFDQMVILNRASQITDVAEWIETQFEFFELFWKVYGGLVTQN